MTRPSILQKRIATALLLATVAVQLHVSGAWALVAGTPVAEAQVAGQCGPTAAHTTDQNQFTSLNGVQTVSIPHIGYTNNSPTVNLGPLTVTSATQLYVGDHSSFVTGNTTYNWNIPLGNAISISGAENMTVTANQPIFGIGFTYFEPSASASPSDTTVPSAAPAFDTTVQVTLRSGASSVGSFTFNAPNDTATFQGFTSPTAFDRIEIVDVTGTIDNEFFGTFFIVTANCSTPPPQCNDGADNDGDNLVDFPQDPGCTSATDNNELNAAPAAQCADGQDNDGDGLVDLADPGCANAADNNELNAAAAAQCSDGLDNDADGAVDFPADVGCTNAQDNDELNPKTQCQDGIDNDGDGLVDFPQDPGCSSNQDNSELNAAPAAQCADGQDNDGDGLVDLADPGCANAADNNELNAAAAAQCSDGLDNDADGAVDFPADVGCTNAQDNDELNPKTQCQDGIDNDGDGLVDFPQDPGCTGNQDNSELNAAPAAQCADGQDNDGDGLVDFPQDPGCSSSTDNNELNNAVPAAQCSDGLDNDGDGAVDFPADVGCTNAQDNDELNPKTQCQDGIDNDGDGLVDFPQDPGCTGNQDNSELNAAPAAQCADGQDNDGDGLVDFPQDPGCTNAADNNELNNAVPPAQCSDGLDNDGDGAVDFPADFSCTNAQDNDELNPKSQCQDGIDNDGDGLVDFPQDPGCSSNQDNSELNAAAPNQCSDGLDNDGDGAIDFPQDFSCSSPTDNDELNPKSQCQDGIDNDGDGLVDFPQDPGCTSNQDDSELNAAPGADLSIAKSGPSTVVRGTTVAYTVTATNAGPGTATNVVIGDVIPAGLTFNQGLSSAGCVLNGNGTSVLCNNFSLNANQSRSFQIVFNVPTIQNCTQSTIQNVATVSASSTDPNSSNNVSQTVSTTLTCPAPTPTVDLSIQKSGPATIVRGNTIFYTITIGNSGTAQATNVVISDAIPFGLTYNDALSFGPCSQQGNSVICTQSTVDAGQFGSFVIAFDVPTIANNCQNTTVTNTASIQATQTDANQSNNLSQTVSTTLTCPAPTPTVDLAIQKSGPATIVRGQTIFYTITVGNSGTTQATNVVITDAIPAGLTYNDSLSFGTCSQQNNNVVCTLSTLDAGQFGSFLIAFDAPVIANCQAATVTNSASIQATQTDANQSNNVSQTVSTTVTCPVVSTVDLAIQKSGPATIIRGQTIFYTITIGNSGTAQATNVIVSDVIPFGLTYNDALSFGPCSQQGNSVICPQSTLDPGQFGSFTIAFDAPVIANCQQTTVTNSASIQSSQTDVNQGNNISQTVSTTVQCPAPLPQCRDGLDNDGDGLVDFPFDPGCLNPDDNDETNQQVQTIDLSIAKSGPATIIRGNTLFYTITIGNAGTAQATNVVITDVIPAGLTYNDALSYAPCSQVGNAVVCTNATIDPGQFGSFLIAFNVPTIQNCQQTTVTNTASIQASQNDPNQGNNVSQTVGTTLVCPAPVPQCRDGLDNDGDGLIDFPLDPGCFSLDDDSEVNAPAAFGCIEIRKETFDPHGTPLPIAAQFTFVLDATRIAYNNALGNARFDQVPAGSHSVSELVPSGWVQLSVTPQNGIVNVTAGGNCAQLVFRNRQAFNATYQCSDGYDNDGDGMIDFPQDPGCTSASDDSEYQSAFQPQCSDGIDNDGDGLVDFPQDQGCVSLNDNNEQNQAQAYACSDGLDNDNDGKVDFPQDTGCYGPADNDEFNFRAPRCSDGVDNDLDGLIDFPNDPGCRTPFDDNEWNSRTWVDRWREWWNWNW